MKIITEYKGKIKPKKSSSGNHKQKMFSDNLMSMILEGLKNSFESKQDLIIEYSDWKDNIFSKSEQRGQNHFNTAVEMKLKAICKGLHYGYNGIVTSGEDDNGNTEFIVRFSDIPEDTFKIESQPQKARKKK